VECDTHDTIAADSAVAMPSELKSERRACTLILTISDAATRNTLSPQIYAAGIEALATAEADPEFAVVLTGDGGHFSAGGNVQRLEQTRRDDPLAQSTVLAQFHQFIEAIRTCPKPVIAAVEGFAAGGGFSLALACDLIVAASDARFVMSYGRIALTPDGGGSWHLSRALPRALVLQALWLAEPLSAAQLHAHGLVNRIAESGQALHEALVLAEALAAMAPNAIAGAKELVDAAASRSLRDHLDSEATHFVQNLVHENAGIGLQAFFDKRPARFR
jgi:enoyl-CoA hydratase/carnithine racemase